MSGSKISPAAVVIGDSKICVFGHVLYGELAYFQHSPPSFEILDTNNLTWSPLPEPPLKYEDFESVYVSSYGVHRSCLIIQINQQGIFGINIDRLKPEWVYLDQSDRIGDGDFPGKGSWTMVGKMLCSPSRVISRGDLQHARIALEGSRGGHHVSTQYGKVALCFDDRCINLCVVRTGPPLRPNIPNLLVDIVKLDDDAFGSDLSKWKGIQSKKSFTFTLTSFCPCNSFNLIGCFPIKQIGEVPKGGEREVMGTWIHSTYKGSVDSQHKIYAGNLSRTLTSEALRDAFADQPGLLSTKVIYKRDTGRCRGFGFITFETAETAEAALESMNGVEVEGRPLRLKRVSASKC